ncbi:hypothetical protein ACFL1M_00940 [Patescibacteria group bacterium]
MNKNTKKIIFIIVATLLALLVVGITIKSQLPKASEEYSSTFTNLSQASFDEEAVVPFEKQEVSDHKVIIKMLNGWNLVSFPHKPFNFRTAAELVVDVADKGGYVTTVSMWDGDRWQEYTQRGQEQYGSNFSIEPGKAYFLRNHKTFDWKIIGEPLTRNDVGEILLQKGWNTVGFVAQEKTASSILNNLNSNGNENANEIDWWRSGTWEPFVKRLYSQDNIKEYGTDFKIEEGIGYMVKTNQEIILNQFK